MDKQIPITYKIANCKGENIKIIRYLFRYTFFLSLQLMSTEKTSNTSGINIDSAALKRETGSYWVRIDGGWFLTKYYFREDLFYFPGHFDGIDPKELHEIDERRLDKQFEEYKRKIPNMAEQAKPNRKDGYYWVLHDAMWFATYYLSSEDVFYFPGQTIGFDPPELEEIDEHRIERSETESGQA